MTSDILTTFTEKLNAAGLLIEHSGADGKLHRCGTIDKPRGKDGAYRIHLDAPACCWWKDWRTGEEGTLQGKPDKDLTPVERKALRERIAAARKDAEEEQAKRHAAAAKMARIIWEKAAPATKDHPYLQRKQVPALGGIRQRVWRGAVELLVPVLDTSGSLMSLQRILPEKPAEGTDKIFLPGGKTAGGYFHIPAKDGDKGGPLLVCEGYATAASLYLATGYACLVAFNAGNLEAVARMTRGKYPEREIIIAADNDCEGDRNPGVEAATKAAQAIGAKLAVCPALDGSKADFNDLHTARSLEAVRMVVEEALAGSPLDDEKPPFGFSIRKEGEQRPGIWFSDPDEEETKPVWVGSPLDVLAATRTDTGTGWGLLLSWKDGDGVRHTWAMSKALLVGRDSSSVLCRLADEGYSVPSSAKAKGLLCRFLSEYRTKRRARCVDRTGWHHGCYVFPDTTIENMSDMSGMSGKPYSDKDLRASYNKSDMSDMSDGSKAERIVLQVQTPHNPFMVSGSLAAWRDTIGTWARGNSRIMLSLSASLAATLLEPVGMESGGINWIAQSSTGKTTTLLAAASIWGSGSITGGYILNWRATANGLEGLAALHSDAALCLDEIGQAPGRTINEAAYLLANGLGKARALSDGSAKAIKSWRTLVLSTGEVSLADRIKEEGFRVQAGQTVRLIDIPADAGAGLGLFEDLHGFASPRELSDAIRKAAATHYGHPSRAFIKKIQENRADFEQALARFMSDGLSAICDDQDASGQVQRVAKRLLLCAVAGEMATEWGIFPWTQGEALDAAKRCFQAWLSLRGGMGAAEDTAILSDVCRFLEANGASRFQDVQNPSAICVGRVGFRRTVDNGTEYYVLPESFKSEVCSGHNPNHAAKVLKEHGLLLPGDGRNIRRKPTFDLPDFGRKRCYVLFVGREDHELS